MPSYFDDAGGEIRVQVINESWTIGGTPEAPLSGRTVGKGFRINVMPGLTEVLKNLYKLDKDLQLAGAMIVSREAKRILALANERVPVATGELMASGRVEEFSLKSKFQMANIIYGGPAGAGGNVHDVDYAVMVHEDLYAHHEHGEAKWLERTIAEERLAETLQQAIITEARGIAAVIAAGRQAASGGAGTQG
jgi:hypothetical protein